jgi:CheY-like chemotaxis protein
LAARSPNNSKHHRSTGSGASRSKAARILLVDDEQEIRSIVSEILTAHGYDVVCASNGLEALDIFRDGFRPCIILLDLMMPVFNGWEFLEARSAVPALAQIPVVVLTAASAGLPVFGARTRVLSKPFAVEDLLERIDEYC